jgi:hypothetical protein
MPPLTRELAGTAWGKEQRLAFGDVECVFCLGHGFGVFCVREEEGEGGGAWA